MVYFDCNACGEALKKNQVEKHRFKCRGCQVLSCVDCQKEFWGDAYKEHTKCISEEEKYSGKDFKPKANANKGEQKQEAWIEQVRAAIAKCDTKPKLKALLGRIQDYPNIPRKKPKFENFVKNSMGCREAWLIAEAWTAINSEIQTQNQDKQQADQSETKNTDRLESSETDVSAATGDSSAPEGAERKLSKRERKEERRKKQHHSEKKEKKGQTADEPVENGHPAPDIKSKKNKKRRRDAEEVPDEDMEEPSQKKKKKKHKKSEAEPEEAIEEAEMEEANESLEPVRKFSWDDTIMQVVHKASGNEIALKKLVKKVLSEFHSCGGDGKTYTEDKLRSKLHKRVFKNPQLKLSKEKIKLVV